MAIDYPDILAENFLEDGTVTLTGSAEDAVFKAQYAVNRSRVSKFVGDSTDPQAIKIDLGAADSANTFVLDKGWVITGGSATLKVQWSDNETDYTTVATLTAASQLAANTLPVWETFTAANHRYWRILLEGHTAAPTIFSVWLGTRIQLNIGPFGPFDPLLEKSVDVDLRTPAGAGQIVHRYRKRELQASFEILTDTLKADLTLVWTQAVQDGKPFFWLWKPADYASAQNSVTAPVLYLSPNGAHDYPISRTLSAGFLTGIEV